MPVETLIENKQQLLHEQLAALPSVIVAFSGGTDSAYLAWAAHEALGPSSRARDGERKSNHERVIAVTALSPSFPASERALAEFHSLV
jgi:uncharacterized protein